MQKEKNKLYVGMGPITSFIGISFSGKGAREEFVRIKVKMPCGQKIVYEDSSKIPTVDTPCPCGDPKHWIVRFE